MLAAATAPLLNAGYYQAAAGLFGVLLLTGVVAEVRASRDRGDESTLSRGELVGLVAFAVLSLVVLAGEVAAMTVLLRQRSSGLLQALVGYALYAGLFGVPALAFSQVVQRYTSPAARRRVARVGAVTLAAGLIVAGAFIGQAQISGQPGVGSAAPVLATGQIEGGRILRASASGRPNSFTDTLKVASNSTIVVGLRVSNPGPGSLRHVVVKIALPNVSSSQPVISGQASSAYANPARTTANVVTLLGSEPLCAGYEPDSTSLRPVEQPGARPLPDGVVTNGVDIGEVGPALEDGRVVFFRLRLRAVSRERQPC